MEPLDILPASRKSGTILPTAQLPSNFSIIPTSLREELFAVHCLVNFRMILNGQLAFQGDGGLFRGVLALTLYPHFCSVLYYNPYPRMQDLQQLRCKLCKVRWSYWLRLISRWRNVFSGQSFKITTRKKFSIDSTYARKFLLVMN